MKGSVMVIASQDQVLELNSAILLYKGNNGQVYATMHPIENCPDVPLARQIGPGTQLTKEALADFASAAAATTAFTGFVPDRLLYTAPNVLAWWVPATERMTWFRESDMGRKSLGNVFGVAAHPAAVFVVTAGSWAVFALQDSIRPGPDTPLCRAPYMNVYADGAICTGNVRRPQTLDASAIAAYEDAFYRSHFTHPNHPRAARYKGGVIALWRDQLAKPDPATMAGALIPSKETLAAAIRRLSK